MAKRLNKKMVVGLTTAGMVVTAAAGILMITYLPTKNPEPFVTEAEKLVANGNFSDASKYYQKAAQRARDKGSYTEDSYKYLIRAGELALKSGDARTALGCWEQVTRNNPRHEKAQEKIVEFTMERATLFGGRSWGELQTDAEKLCSIADEKGTKNYVGLHALGRALIEQRALDEKNVEKGVKLLTEAIEGDKSNPEYADSLGQHYFREQQFDKAEGIYNTLLSQENLSKDPKLAATAYRYRGRFHLSMRFNYEEKLRQQKEKRANPNELAALSRQIAEEDQKCHKDIEKAIELNPQDVDALVAMGKYWQLKKSSAADPNENKAETAKNQETTRQYYEMAILTDPDHYTAYLELAQFYYADMQEVDKAVKVLEERIDRGIKRDHYLGWRHGQYMAMVRNAAFRINLYKVAMLRQKAEAGQEEETDKMVQATKDKLWDLYRKTVAEVAGGEEDPNALYMKGRLLELDGKIYEAIKELEKAERTLASINLDIKRALAGLYIRNNTPGAAEAALNIIISAYGNDDASLAMLATIQAQANPETAVETANRALAINPKNRTALLAKGEAYKNLRNFEGIKQIQEQISQLDQTQDTPGNKLAKAQIMLAQAVSATPPDTQLQAQAEKLLYEVLDARPYDIRALRSVLPMLEKREGGPDQINKLLARAREALEKDKDRPATAATAPATAPEGMTKAVYQSIANVLKSFELYLDKSIDEETKLKRVEEIIKQGEDPYSVAIDLFNLYRSSNKIDEAYEQLKKANQLKPDNPQIIDNLFLFALHKKDWETAEQCKDKAIALGMARAGGHFYQGRILLSRKDLENNYAKAESEFRAGLNDFPSYVDGRIWLGEALLNLGRYDEAASQFQQARKLDPANALAVVGLAQTASLQGNRQLVDQYIDICVKLAPNHPFVVKEMLARKEKEDPKAGIIQRERQREANPADLENLMALANLYSLDKQYDKAREVYQQCLQKEPENLGILQQYAVFLRTKVPPELQEAEKIIREKIQQIDSQKAPQKATAQLLLASHLEAVAQQEQNLVNQAVQEKIDTAYEAASGISETPDIQVQIGQYFQRSNNLEKAIEWFRKTIESSIKTKNEQMEREVRSLLIDTMIQVASLATFEAAGKEIAAYKEKYPEDSFSMLLEGEYYLSMAQDQKAIEFFTQYVTRNPDMPMGFYRRGAAYYRQSQWNLAVEDLRQAKRLDPAFYQYQPRMLLIRALESNGKTDEAIAEMQEMVNENANTSLVFLRLYETYRTLKRINSALNLINTRIQAEPNNPTLYLYMAHLADDQNQEAMAIKHATTAVEKSNYSLETVNFLISAYLKYGKNDPAVQVAVQAAEKNKQQPEFVNVLLSLYLRLEQFDNVLNYLADKLKPDQFTSITHIQSASAYLGKNDIAKAIDAYILSLKARDFEPGLFVSTCLQDVRVQSRTDALLDALNKRIQTDPDKREVKFLTAVISRRKNEDQFIKLTKELIEATPADNPQNIKLKIFLLRDMLAGIYLKQNNSAGARQAYEDILKFSPREPLSLNNLAYLLVEKFNDPKSALTYAQQAVNLSPNDSNVLDTLGWNYVLLDKYTEGIMMIRKAVQINTQIPALHYHLAEAFYRRANSPNATPEEKSLEEAKNECNVAHSMIMRMGRDIGDVLGPIVALGEKLGLKLEKEIPKTQPATQPATIPVVPS